MSVTDAEKRTGATVESRNGAGSRPSVTGVENARVALVNNRNDRRLFRQLLEPAKEEARQATERAREAVALQHAAGEFSDSREGFWRVAAELSENRPSEEKEALRLAREARRTASVCGSCGRDIQGDENVYRNAGLYVGMATLLGIGPKYENTVVCEGCAPDYMKREAKGEPTELPGGRLSYLSRFVELPCGVCDHRVVVKKSGRYRRYVFCSERCQWTHHNGTRNQRSARSREKTCEACGEAFTATRRDAKTCSASCKQKAYRRRKKGGAA